MNIKQLKNEDILEHIKNNISVLDVVNKLGGLGLKKVGNSLMGNCPSNHKSKGGQ